MTKTPWGDPTAPPHRRLGWWWQHAPILHASFELAGNGISWACRLAWGNVAGPAGVTANGATAEAAVDAALAAFDKLTRPDDATQAP